MAKTSHVRTERFRGWSIFYEQELARVKKNLQEEEFIVDHVIKNRGRGSNKQLLISWRGYSSKFDTCWRILPASSLIHLRDGGKTISHGSFKQYAIFQKIQPRSSSWNYPILYIYTENGKSQRDPISLYIFTRTPRGKCAQIRRY